MTRKIKCKNCGHVWSSNAKTLKARGVYCRDCRSNDLTWFSDYTGAEIKYKDTKWENEDFLSKEELEDKSKISPDLQEVIMPKNLDEEVLTKEEVRRQQVVEKAEQLVTKAGKKFSLRSTDDMLAKGLGIFEDFQNRRFEESGYSYKYGEAGSENVRNEMIDAFQEAYGLSSAISPELAFWILFGVYSMPTIYHEARYKSLGVKIKSWWSKYQAKRKEKAVLKADKKRKGREELSSELEELEDFVK